MKKIVGLGTPRLVPRHAGGLPAREALVKLRDGERTGVLSVIRDDLN